jgi:hypothetical protein
MNSIGYDIINGEFLTFFYEVPYGDDFAAASRRL